MPENTPSRLTNYRRKRDFRRTSEPSGGETQWSAGERYVMHRHAASHDHFDLRLERDGVLRSWALPKGPSLRRGEKRLAIEVEDHPIEYGSFEGTIPKGEYGGGTVMLWDTGSWRVTGKFDDDRIDFALDGSKLQGQWTLVRTRARAGKPANNWLLIKRGEGNISRRQAHDRSVRSGRTMAEIARGAAPRADRAPAASDAPPIAADIPGARRKHMPTSLAPQLATRTREAPDGEDWLHEIKFDGYRVVVHLRAGEVRILSRNGHDWTARFAAQAERLGTLAATDAILDGEMVAMGADGATSFRDLQERIAARDTDHLILQLFDLMHLDRHDLRTARLEDRKAALKRLLMASGFGQTDLIRFSDHVVGNGPAFFHHACAIGLEGTMAKRADARYSSRRTRSWLKLKCSNHEEFVVGGYTRPSGTRKGFGALLLGAWEGDALHYMGRVGSGFNDRQLRELHAMLRDARMDASPFAEDVPDARTASWVTPAIVVEVEFTERTRDGRLRHPTFRGVREDREADEIRVAPEPIVAPVATRGHAGGSARPAHGVDVIEGIRITHPERIVYPDTGVSKLGLARFYAEIQDWLLPHLANRLLSLVRCPKGRQEGCFFQKELTARQAKNVPRQGFRHRDGIRQYAYVQSIAHVIALVQAGVLEFHPFGSLVTDPEHPDLMVFDLDPSPGVPWSEILRATRALRQRLDSLELPSFVRTTGGKGLHVVVPLRPSNALDWDGVKAFAKAVSERHAADDPTHLTTMLSKAKRGNRIFIDYLRNSRGATAIASYSTRARPGAPVAVPIRWDELTASLRPDRYTVANLRRRLAILRTDPWDDFHDARVSITDRMRKAVGLK